MKKKIIINIILFRMQFNFYINKEGEASIAYCKNHYFLELSLFSKMKFKKRHI